MGSIHRARAPAVETPLCGGPNPRCRFRSKFRPRTRSKTGIFRRMNSGALNLDLAHLRTWIGREENETDVAAADPVRRLTATLDRDDPFPEPGAELPPLAHWLYFLPHFKQSDLRPDGHGKLGGFLPPLPLPRRMWAGSRITFHSALRAGDSLARRSKITGLDLKEGRSGALVFLTLRHEISTPRGLAITEEQDLVYRGEAAHEKTSEPVHAKATTQPAAAPAQPLWSHDIDPHPTLLFRYSALTFNAHRIHYDLPYARDVEAYPGLVVHGPLTATLLLDLLRRHAPEKKIKSFSFRGLQPLFAGAKFRICAGPWGDDGSIDLWAESPEGLCATRAQASVAMV
jgi:3-methylfumaryl-CoA hydratase